MSKWICFLFLIAQLNGYQAVFAENETASSSSQTDVNTRADLGSELGKTSSSYVPNPDPLDPLPLKQESLKEDEEPVLDDIKQILNSPLKKKKKVTSPQGSSNGTEHTTADGGVVGREEADATTLSGSDPQTAKKKSSSVKSSKKISVKKLNRATSPSVSSRSPDDPDLNLENKFHRIYQAYNSQPTSSTEWSKVNEGRESHELIVEPGNTLDGISRMLFGDSKFWPKIWSLNNPGILNPHQIYPGFKLYFYPGTQSEVPAVSTVKKQNLKENSVVSLSKNSNILTAGKNPDGREYGYQNTELNKITTYSDTSKIEKPQPIPGSLPEHFDKNYFKKSGQITPVIRLQHYQQIPDSIPTNPYILTSSLLQPDFKVAESQIEKIMCRDNQYIQLVEKLNLSASPGSYKIVESKLVGVNRFKKTNIYRVIGTAEINANSSMRIKGCKNLVNSDALIVSEEKLSQLAPPTETFDRDATIVESLNNDNQAFFHENQFVVLSSANAGFAPGQDLNVYSESEGAVVGQLKVLQVMGTLSVGYIRDLQNIIQFGDQVQIAGGVSDGLPATEPFDSMPSLDPLPQDLNLDHSSSSDDGDLTL